MVNPLVFVACVYATASKSHLFFIPRESSSLPLSHPKLDSPFLPFFTPPSLRKIRPGFNRLSWDRDDDEGRKELERLQKEIGSIWFSSSEERIGLGRPVRSFLF